MLKLGFESTKKINPESAAYLLPVLVNSLHMFKDANGRVSRTLHLLLNSENKTSFENNLRKALDENGRYDAPDLDPALLDFDIQRLLLIENYGWSLAANGQLPKHKKLKGGIASVEYSQIDKTNPTYVENIQKFKQIESADFYYLLTAIVETLTPEQYNSILWDGRYISPIKMETLKEEDWQNIFDFYYKLKREHIKTLVSVFVEPEKYHNPENQSETLKDMFIREVKENYNKNLAS